MKDIENSLKRRNIERKFVNTIELLEKKVEDTPIRDATDKK
jgi:hypothetical protein